MSKVTYPTRGGGDGPVCIRRTAASDEENMMSITRSTHSVANHSESCTPEQRVTKSLLGYDVIAGSVYVATSLVQALVWDGFDRFRPLRGEIC